MWKCFYSLLKKDGRMMASGKFFFAALGSLALYTLFLHAGFRDFADTAQRREITCKLLFIEIAAAGFLGTASVLFKEKQMGVIRVHAVMPLNQSLFLGSKAVLFLLSDLVFAALMVLFNLGPAEAEKILPDVLLQTAVLSLIMFLTAFVCTMLFRDFKQFSMAYAAIVVFAAFPVFLPADAGAKIKWISRHPFYHLYGGLKRAFSGRPVTSPAYYIGAACAAVLLCGLAEMALRREMRKEG